MKATPFAGLMHKTSGAREIRQAEQRFMADGRG
jgi:hypothetical protein